MSDIDELIARLCPDGVEFERTGDIADVGTGNRDRKDAVDEGDYPFYVRSHEVMRIDKYQFDEEAIVIPGEGGIGDIFHFVSGRYGLHQRAYRISFTTQRLIPRFAYYHFVASFKQFILARALSATVTSIRKPMIEDFPVPVPPLQIQTEIVEVLDTFVELQSLLEAELEVRRRQYVFYRDSLFALASSEHTWSTLGKVAANLDSQRRPITKSARLAGTIPYYGASGVVDHVREHIFDGDYLLVSEDGANLLARSTPIAFSISGKTWVNNHAHVLEFESYAERRFVEIYLNSIDLSPYVSGAAQPKLNQANLNKIPIPVPPLEEQERIVEILDKFDALVNDRSIGLAAELRARRQQYGHYRDRLLTFDQAAA